MKKQNLELWSLEISLLKLLYNSELFKKNVDMLDSVIIVVDLGIFLLFNFE